jgi:hypothetical protein
MNATSIMFDISCGPNQHTIYDIFLFHKLFATWGPRHLTPKLKVRCRNICMEFLQQCGMDDGFLRGIVTGDEIMVSV